MLQRARQTAVLLVLLFLSGAALAVPAAQLPDFTGIVAKYGPAVVNVEAHYKHASELNGGGPAQTSQPPLPEIFRRFFGMPYPPQQPRDHGAESLGSGFIVSADGYILTNDHVVENADSVKVKLSDRRVFDAKVIGTDRVYDIALLKIKATDLPTVAIGNSQDIKPGQWVVAIGSPYGLDHSVSAGIISYVGRSLGGGDQPAVPFIQTDVPINRGNSGGPLFNLQGQVIGINSQIFSTSGGSMGLSFSIPINLAMNAVQQLKTRGFVSRGMMGVEIQNVDDSIAKANHMSQVRGAAIVQVTPGGPADKAGLQIGDIIVGFDGKPVDTSADLPPMVAMTSPGKQADVKILRNGKPMTVEVRIGQMPRGGLTASNMGPAPGTSGSDLLGLTVQALTPDIRQQLGYSGKGGVVISDVRGPAGEAGLQEGDIVLRVGNHPIDNVGEFRRATAGIKRGDTVLLLVSRDNSNRFVAISVPKK
jgi:serine protease Do